VKVVLDTNVFASVVFFDGPPAQILEAWHVGIIQFVVSPEILDEYRRVAEILAEDYPIIDLKAMLDYVVQNVETCSPLPLPEPVCDDPDDDKFLACAMTSGCNIIVSGDKHLLRVSGYQKIQVLKPRDFVEEYLK
jgi:uncharacterized protein